MTMFSFLDRIFGYGLLAISIVVAICLFCLGFWALLKGEFEAMLGGFLGSILLSALSFVAYRREKGVHSGPRDGVRPRNHKS